MNITRRFTLMVKGNLNNFLDSIEDPERSLHQLVIDMEEQLETAKRAAAQAIANEDRLRAKITFHRQDAVQWERAARRLVGREAEDEAREPLRRAELANRQAAQLEERLAEQERDTSQVRLSVARMNDQISDARSRLQLLQARMRQGEARRAIDKALRGADSANLYGEFERLGDRVETCVATEAAYLRLDDELTGDDLRRQYAADEVDDAVEIRLQQLRAETESTDSAA